MVKVGDRVYWDAYREFGVRTQIPGVVMTTPNQHFDYDFMFVSDEPNKHYFHTASGRFSANRVRYVFENTLTLILVRQESGFAKFIKRVEK